MRVAVIGCGRAALRCHMPALRRRTDVHLVGVADPCPAAASAGALEAGGCPSFASARELFQATVPEAVVLATPPDTHVELMLLAAARGAAVLVEKPLALDANSRVALRDIATPTAPPIMVAFNRRHWRPVQRLRGSLAGRRGIAVQANFRLDTEGPASASGGDVLTDLVCHQGDLLPFLFDARAHAVRAGWTHGRQGVWWQARLEGGALVRGQASHTGGYREELVVRAGRWRYAAQGTSDRIRPASGPVRMALDGWDRFHRALCSRRPSLQESYDHQMAVFLDHARTRSPPECGWEAGMEAVRFVEAVRRSADNGGLEIPLD